MSYFAVGGGKFLGGFLGIDDRVAGIFLILLALIYTAVSGFYGVVLTDVFQGILIFVAIVYICFITFQTVSLPETFAIAIPGTEQLQEWSLREWSSIIPPIKIDLPGDYSIFNLFGGVMLFYIFKVFLEGGAGGGGYMIQRYFAARNDREAGLLSLFWIFLLSFRWSLVTALAILGIDYGLKNQIISDPELVLPTVISAYIPVGVKGLLVACFIAAAMSTFDSIINASAAYWVKDIYQAYIKPEASNQQLVNQGRLASVFIVSLGLIFSFNITNINDIWGWLTLGLGTGLFIPLVLRWYWWRFNGYGFAIGTGAGLIAAILTKAVILPLLNMPQLQEYILFLVPSICSFLGCIFGTFLTPATNLEVIDNFYRVTRPFGFWGVVSQNLPTNLQAKIQRENRRDIMATLIAIPWQLVLFLMGMMLMMKRWDNFGVLLLMFILLSIGLYFTWFKYLDKIQK